ncbi:hypothetical protein CsSME_00018055 [Camellia sinensis var. sinensis]
MASPLSKIVNNSIPNTYQPYHALGIDKSKKKSLRSKKQNWWDDDVVFKNQARGESKAPKRFINDTIRNDFHRKFLHKYMKIMLVEIKK